VCSASDLPLPFWTGEKIEVRGFVLGVTTKRNPHPILSLGEAEAKDDATQIR